MMYLDAMIYRCKCLQITLESLEYTFSARGYLYTLLGSSLPCLSPPNQTSVVVSSTYFSHSLCCQSKNVGQDHASCALPSRPVSARLLSQYALDPMIVKTDIGIQFQYKMRSRQNSPRPESIQMKRKLGV